MRNVPKGFLVILLVLLMAATMVVLTACDDDDDETEESVASVTSEETQTPQAEGSKLEKLPMPENPYLNNEGYAGAHGNVYNSGVQPLPGPLGINPVIHSQLLNPEGMAGCSVQAFDAKGRIITIGGANTSPSQLVLLDPEDLTVLAKEVLPQLSGFYFRLDNQGRIITTCGDETVRIYEVIENESGPAFSLVKSYDVSGVIPEEKKVTFFSTPLDSLVDWSGNLWFATIDPAAVGYINPNTGNITSILLEGERVENGICASQDGVFIVTNQHLYGMRAQPDSDQPEVFMKFEYDRGTGTKAMSSGSGTAPTIFGGGKLIAFGDSAEPRQDVLVYRLDDVEDSQRLVCKVPVFPAGQSVLENSFIGYGYSLVVENNYGYNFMARDWSEAAPGLVRIDVREDLSGADIIWENDSLISGCGPKLSTGNGLIYQYCLEPGTDGVWDYYFAAIDFETGDLVWKAYAGSGDDWDNMMFTLSIGPNGLLTVGLYHGIASLQDG